MPKITVDGGPSNALGQDPEDAAPGQPDPAQDSAPEPPPASAPKAEHVDYAVGALGVSPEEAESMTKPDLVELARGSDPEPEPAKPQPKPKGAGS